MVAVCLHRILEASSNGSCCCEYRAPISESLAKLSREQLQKFAQYLLSELPSHHHQQQQQQHILPTAQRLLDKLLLDTSRTSINATSGAPDPTAGAASSDRSVWCVDEAALHESVRRALLKFLAPPAPHIVSDIECLHEHANHSATAAEYAALLRPLRGNREPEAMWNLLGIVRDMVARRDANALPLLRLVTGECLRSDLIVLMWFLARTNVVHASSSSCAAGANSLGKAQACATLMDELVALWRIVALCLESEPGEEMADEQQLERELVDWHEAIVARIVKCTEAFLLTSQSQMLNNNNNNNNNTVSRVGGAGSLALCWSMLNVTSNGGGGGGVERALKGLNVELFVGMLPAIAACRCRHQKTRQTYEIQALEEQCINALKQELTEPTNNQVAATAASVQTTSRERALFKCELKRHADPLVGSALVFVLCEALHAHGMRQEALVVARLLATRLLLPLLDDDDQGYACLFKAKFNTKSSISNIATVKKLTFHIRI